MIPQSIRSFTPLAILLSLSVPLIAAAPAYKVGQSFGQQEISSPPVAMAMNAKDQITVLLSSGTVITYNSSGKMVGKFESLMNPLPGAMTVDGGRIYLLANETHQRQVESQGRKRTIAEPAGVKCAVYSPSGEKVSEFGLPEVVSARDAHMVGGQLVVGDYRKSQIVFFSLAGGQPKVERKIEGVLRLCCGLLDFCPTADGKSILVANLGAFKVQTFTGTRKSAEFGARGEKLDEFHGCCNPVNVAAIGSDAIVTVEKDPTRVKVYGRKGKGTEAIEGLGELVNGCSSIPVAVDSTGAIYLASSTKRCIVKCVSDTAPKGMSAPASEAMAPPAGSVEWTEDRAWRDEGGRTVQGKLIAFDSTDVPRPTLIRDGKVRLLVGRKTYDLEVSRLVGEDQDFIRKRAAEMESKQSP